MQASVSASDHAVTYGASFALRLTARRPNVALLRAHLRLWLQTQTVTEDELEAVLAKASDAFGAARAVGERVRPLLIDVEAIGSAGGIALAARAASSGDGSPLTELVV